MNDDLKTEQKPKGKEGPPEFGGSRTSDKTSAAGGHLDNNRRSGYDTFT
jgi:hypothetical protein